PGVLADLWIPSRDKSVGLVALAEVATITPGLVPSEIDRFNRRRVVTIESGLTKEMPLETATRHAKRILADMHLPAGYGLKESGKSLEMKEMMLFSFESFVLSVALMYMVLASQFENLLDPIIILLTLPLAVPFALVSLTAAHMTLNLFSMLGLFLLFGVVKKNAILQIDRTNELIAGGTPLYDAVLQANKQRLRPILMTTVTLVVALIPAAMAGPTGATQSPMAVVVVGGQSMCLLLTLLLVPAASSYADQLKQIGSWRIWQRLGWRRSEETSP
ncbi:MAG: efflux RND transporter permease subunit, partial [Armatimonadetes bacterium]|nr:efflux RND transporter permease subunit [Armatimonadota bacterium]